jgi:ParB family chromosome partitioning protein
LRVIPTQSISRNPFQPRQDFDAESLSELAGSIREHGVLQPLLVREIENGYQLVAGERRWLAAQKAGLTSVPCRVVDVIDKTACEFALEENLKRKDLNDLEKAVAFRSYLKHFECTVEELAKQLSMSRSAVSNLLRLLELPESVQTLLRAGKLSAGHARALLPLPEADQQVLCERIQSESLSVRQVEAAVRELLGRPAPASAQSAAVEAVSPATPDPAAAPAVEAAVVNHAGGAEGVVDPAHELAGSAQAAVEMAASSGDSGETISIEAARDEAEQLRSNHVISLEEQLSSLFGVKVQIKLKSRESGEIVIPFSSNQEFERLLKVARRAG